MLTDTDFAYLAGIIDGEGSIILHQDPRDRRVWGEIQVSNSSNALITWLLSKFGGRAYIASHSRRDSTSYNRKQMYLVRWNGKLSRDLIPRLLPYLIEKKEKALLLLKLTLIPRPQISNEEHKEVQDMIYKEFSMARRKGAPVAPKEGS